MRMYVKKGGRYGFALTNGEHVEGTVLDHVHSDGLLKVQVEGREGPTRIVVAHICQYWVIDESAAEEREPFID